MIPQQQFFELLKMLLEKSRANQVNWLEEGSNWYQVSLPDCVIQIGMVSPHTDPDFYRAMILNKGGRVLAQWTVTEVGDPQGIDALELLRSLFEEAERSVTGWDAVLRNLKSELASDGVIGTPS